MAEKKLNPWMVLGLIIVAVYLVSNTQMFSISLFSPQVQYYNSPITAVFETNLTNPTITAYFNNKELFEIVANDSNQTAVYTKELINGSYTLTLKNISQEGLFKFIAVEGNNSETQVIEVKKPYIDVKYNITTLTEKGKFYTFQFKTYTPQGEPLSVDSLDVDVYDPEDKMTTITPVKKGEIWETVFNYKEAGNYQFKIHARKDGFETKEFTAITNVTKTQGVHPIIWIWSAAILIWIILFAIKRFRK